jgi:hypothetical protein
MTPLDRLVVHQGPVSPADAERIMVERKVKKLPLVNRRRHAARLVTARDLVRQRRLPFATRDEQGRLRVGAAASARTGDYLERRVRSRAASRRRPTVARVRVDIRAQRGSPSNVMGSARASRAVLDTIWSSTTNHIQRKKKKRYHK